MIFTEDTITFELGNSYWDENVKLEIVSKPDGEIYLSEVYPADSNVVWSIRMLAMVRDYYTQDRLIQLETAYNLRP